MPPLPQPNRHAVLLQSLSLRYRSPLFSFFEKRVKGIRPVDVEDLVQEVFVRLAQRADLGEIGQIEGYLFQTAANLLKDRARWQGVRDSHEGRPEKEFSPRDEGLTPERVLLGEELLDRVAAALHELPERTRTVFVLHRFEELRYEDIARRAGISLSAVEKHIMKAMAHIKLRLGAEAGRE